MKVEKLEPKCNDPLTSTRVSFICDKNDNHDESNHSETIEAEVIKLTLEWSD